MQMNLAGLVDGNSLSTVAVMALSATSIVVGCVGFCCPARFFLCVWRWLHCLWRVWVCQMVLCSHCACRWFVYMSGNWAVSGMGVPSSSSLLLWIGWSFFLGIRGFHRSSSRIRQRCHHLLPFLVFYVAARELVQHIWFSATLWASWFPSLLHDC